MDEASRTTPSTREPRFFRWVSLLEVAIGCLALVTILVMVLLQAAQRFLPISGWPWTGELARFCLAWLTFIMLGYLTGQGRQITLQLVDTLRSQRLVRAVKIFADLAVAAIGIGFAIACFDLVSNDTGQVSPALGLPMVWLYVIPMAGFAFTALRSIAAIFLPDIEDPNAAPDGPDAEVTR